MLDLGRSYSTKFRPRILEYDTRRYLVPMLSLPPKHRHRTSLPAKTMDGAVLYDNNDFLSQRNYRLVFSVLVLAAAPSCTKGGGLQALLSTRLPTVIEKKKRNSYLPRVSPFREASIDTATLAMIQPAQPPPDLDPAILPSSRKDSI